MIQHLSRAYLLRWVGCFFLTNMLLACCMMILFYSSCFFVGPLNWATLTAVSFRDMLFLVSSFCTQMGLLFFASSFLVLLTLFFFPYRVLVMNAGIMITTLLMAGLIADAAAFRLYHMHYASVAWEIVKVGAMSEVLYLSFSERMMLLLTVVALLMLEILIAWCVWRATRKKVVASKKGPIWAAVLMLMGVMSYASMLQVVHASVSPHKTNRQNERFFFKVARIVPYYYNIYQLLILGNADVHWMNTSEGVAPVQIADNQMALHYPKHPLQCNRPHKALNILIIGIDTWRYDAMNARVTPNIAQFAQSSWQFQQHLSGGNATRPGLFSFFYGLPPTYWNTFLMHKRGPILIHKLLEQGYQFGIFASAPLNFPAFDQTIFKEVPHLNIRTPGNSTLKRDRQITRDFVRFLKQRKTQQPFFGFLFYDAAHNYCEPDIPKNHPFQPAVSHCDRFALDAKQDPTPYLNRYHNAVHFVDAQFAQILAALKTHHLLDDTLIIITADHGEQFNDEHMGYWDHASAYTPYQLHVPMIIRWPHKKKAIYNHFTTHYDVVPTLLRRVLGCDTPMKNYTIGHMILTPGASPFLIAGSYADYAILTHRQIVRIYPAGDYLVNDLKGRLMRDTSLHTGPLQATFELLTRYH